MPILEPVDVTIDKSYPKSTLGTFKGGLWIAKAQTIGGPESDPFAWHCIIDSIDEMKVALTPESRFRLSLRMATGTLLEDTFDIPFPKHKGIWEEGEYKCDDIVTKGHSFWQAMEDTSGEPPGNGWKQILTAPRGKQGEPGKSIKGDPGPPGRNAVLPANFVEDIVKIASERKEFVDGRSGAEAITSYRGFFTSSESYRSGDVVNFDGNLYLCIRSVGPSESIASQWASWEQMLKVAKPASVPDYMLWRGDWFQKEYSSGHVVRDGDWTMVANKRTNDTAAPYPIGGTKTTFAGTMTPYSNLAKTIVYGQRFTNSSGAKILNGFKLDTISGYHYRLFTVLNPEQQQIINEQVEFVSNVTGISEFAITSTLLAINQVLDVVVQVDQPDPTPTQWTGNWNYTTPQNNAIPVAGQIVQSNALVTSFRINVVDSDAINRSIDLSTLDVGDRISDGAFQWTIDSIVNNGTWYDLNVSPGLQSSPDGVREFIFNSIAPSNIDIGIDTDYWLSNPNTQGLFIADGEYEDVIPNNNAYGIVDVIYQDAYISADWDVVSSGAVVAAAGAASLNEQDIVWVQQQSTAIELFTVTTNTNNWTEVGRHYLANGSGWDIDIKVISRRTDSFGFGSSRYSTLAFRNGGVTADSTALVEHYPIGLSFRVKEYADYIAYEVRGHASQNWNWNVLALPRPIV
jgi:hypothetical protein